MSAPHRRRASPSLLVAIGIGASRLSGLGRETVAARLLGNTAAGDAFAVAMRVPNMLQNLLGEGVLSASFVPVYSQLLDAHSDPEAPTKPREHPGEVAAAVLAALITVVGLIVVGFITLARPVTFLLAPGLSADRFELAVSLVRVTALGVGFVVISAWCLGVLNSHRQFFLSYAAPVLWNIAQVAGLLVAWILAFDLDGTARALAWGVVAGGAAQLLMQLPTTLRLAGGVRLRWRYRSPAVREIRRRFTPALLGRGVLQVSAYLDLMLASLLATGAVAALYRAQMLYMMPVSLFAMSIAAAELPEMSRLTGSRAQLMERARTALRRVVFWMLLCAALFCAGGDLAVALLFEGGEFSSDDTVLVWFVVIAYALGLPATGASRVLQNACFATGDPAGPARVAAVRVVVAAAIGIVVMFPLDRIIVAAGSLTGIADALGFAWSLPLAERELGDSVRLGAVGLALGSGIAAWFEVVLLSLRFSMPTGLLAALGRLMPAASLAFCSAAVLKLILGGLPALGALPVLVSAPLVAFVATGVYAVAARRSGVAESELLLAPARRVIYYRKRR